MVDGHSADPVGDFVAIQQELRLFNPAMAHKTQVVVVNKLDIPAVRERAPLLMQQIRAAAGHSRVMGISAATGENVRDLMRRVGRLVGTVQDLPVAAVAGSVASESGVDEDDHSFVVQTDERYPGQFRVVGRHIEKVSVGSIIVIAGDFNNICALRVC